MPMEVYFKMTRQSRILFEEELSKIESEHAIQMMEAKLEYHRKMSMTFENSLVSEQKRLSSITGRQKRNNRIQNHIRDAMRQSRGDDSE